MIKHTEVMKQALEALKSCDAAHITDGGRQWYDEKLVDKAVEAIEKALASEAIEQPAQPAQPLTDEQKAYFVNEIVQLGTGFVTPLFAIVEAIEKAARGEE